MMTNLAANKHDMQMVVNKVLTASRDESGGLSIHGGGNDSDILESVGSKQMITFLMARQKYHQFDMFVKFTYYQKLHFDT